jgi:hypothetical protein
MPSVLSAKHFHDERATLAFIQARVWPEDQTVNHAAEENVRKGDPIVDTNTVENVRSVFQRGIRSKYQHCAKHHLHRYMAEFHLRYSGCVALGVDNAERTNRALGGVVGKRLKFRGSMVA